MTIKQYNYYTKLKSHVNMHVEIFFLLLSFISDQSSLSLDGENWILDIICK